MKTERIITLTTDFGLKDGYAGAVKGAILSINPGASIVDISHDISPHDILEGAFVLYQSYSFFPPGTVHVAVVDPGVGGKRMPVLIKTERYIFIGPDNGIFSMALRNEAPKRHFSLTKGEYLIKEISSTFHGRDIFAPVAAQLSLGEEPSCLGEEIKDIRKVEWADPVLKGNRLEGIILHIDRFGNLITNISRDDLLSFSQGGAVKIRIGEMVITGLSKTYSDGGTGRPVALISSLNLLEIAFYMESAQKMIRTERLKPLIVERVL
ncbi:MAG: S-adenosyl-l-methionine hydroxide adenosyltransferase family protein [Thermodesulfobacteriota bacterium]